MEVTGTVVKLLKLQEGESARGGWKKQEFILKTEGDHPKDVCIALWGDKIEQSNIKEGDKITASINIESREFNERWYTDVKAWKINKGSAVDAYQSKQPETVQAPADDEMPF